MEEYEFTEAEEEIVDQIQDLYYELEEMVDPLEPIIEFLKSEEKLEQFLKFLTKKQKDLTEIESLDSE